VRNSPQVVLHSGQQPYITRSSM